MRAVILAAGEGRRLRPLTKDRPKCLVEYQGKPLLDYQLEVMRRCGLEKILIVKGYRGDKIERPGVEFVTNPDYASSNMVYTFFCAEPFFDDDLLVSYGDILYEESILEAVLQASHDFAVAVSMNWRELWQRRGLDPVSDAETLKMDEDERLIEVGRKATSLEEIQGQYMGLFKIRKRLLGPIRSIYSNLDRMASHEGRDWKNMFMTTFIQMLIDRGYPVKAVPVYGEWLEVDRKEDLDVPCPALARADRTSERIR